MTDDKQQTLNPLTYMVDGCQMREGISMYAQALSEGDAIDNIHADKVQQYMQALDVKVEKEAQKYMVYILSLIQNYYPNLWVQAFLRVKSFLSFEKKINHTLVEAWKTHKDIQYDELTQKLIHELNYGLNDILAYRFIIHGETEEQAILTIYQIANFLIPEMEKYGLIAQAHPKLKGITHKEGKSPYLNDEYEKYFKDYIFHKKQNGYQSLHIIFWSINLGRYIEVQFRTPSMNFCAEYGEPSHRDYKMKKYNPDFTENAVPPVVAAAKRLKILQYPDLEKINIQHFFVDKIDGKLKYFDGAGLIDPLIRKQMILIDGKIKTIT